MRKKHTYEQVYDGEPYYPARRRHFEQCCDCGKVHEVRYDVVDSRTGDPIKYAQVKVTAWQDGKRTAAVRRAFNFTPDE